jgi:uncharacterized membrane protein
MKTDLEIQKATADAVAFFDATARNDAPLFEQRLTAHRSLAPLGFVWLMGIICSMFLIPLLVFLGSLFLWGILIPIVATVGGLWFAIHRNNIDRSICDHIRMWPDQMAVQRINPNGDTHHWLANPQWVKFHLKDTPTHKNYLTLTGGGREIEIGSFLTEDERAEIFHTLIKHRRIAVSAKT